MRMVGRCLVCSRLISTWVSSLEPPPSTPSIVPHQRSHRHRRHRCRHYHHQHQHHHRHYRHQDGSFPPPADTPLSRRSKFTSVSYVSPRPITDSSFSSRSRGSLRRPAALRLLLLSRVPTPLIVTQPSPPVRCLSPPSRLSFSLHALSPLVDPWRSVLFGPVYPTGFALAESRDSGLFTPFPARTPAARPSSSLAPSSSRAHRCAFLLLRIRLSQRAEDRSPHLPRFAASTPLIPGFPATSTFNPLARPLGDTSSIPSSVDRGVEENTAPRRDAMRRVAQLDESSRRRG